MNDGLLDRVRMRLATQPGELSGLLLDGPAQRELSEQMQAELLGAGPLETWLAEPGVTDVLVNGAEQAFIDRGAGLQPIPVRFDSPEAVRRLAVRLAAQAGRRLDDAQPFVDAVLPDGTRLHAILPPLVDQPAISLRVLGRRRLNLSDLVALQMLSATTAGLLSSVVRARLGLLVSGGTGAGKTSLLAALLAQVPPAERIITIEDAPELRPEHPHVISLQSRSGNSEGCGAIGPAELVRQALRMRPDRLVVGEFRGAEIADLLAALNTGHAGGAATVHANSVRDVPARLSALGALAGLGPVAVAAQAASALDVVVHVQRGRDGRRGVQQVALWSREPERRPELVWTAEDGEGPAVAQLRQRLIEAGEAESAP